jgi:hypothetical protein
VDAPPAARFPLEVLYSIRNVGLLAIDTRVCQGLIQDRACRTDERAPGKIFFVARLLANE